MQIFVISMGGPALTPAMHQLLYHAAHQLYNENIRKADFSSPNFKGQVTTQRSSVSIGSLSGVEFLAHVEVASDTVPFTKWTIKFGVATTVLESPESELLASEPIILKKRRQFTRQQIANN